MIADPAMSGQKSAAVFENLLDINPTDLIGDMSPSTSASPLKGAFRAVSCLLTRHRCWHGSQDSSEGTTDSTAHQKMGTVPDC